MGTVVSLTEAKIRELLNGWQNFSLTQNQISDLVAILSSRTEGLQTSMEQLQNVTIPELILLVQQTAGNVSDLNEGMIADLQTGIQHNSQQIQNVINQLIPAVESALLFELEQVSTAANDALDAHKADPDAHPQYATQEWVIANVPPADETMLAEHINSPTPHPAYDDGPSFLLLYNNAKV